MKTIILSLSPRVNFSASLYYSKMIKIFLNQDDVTVINLKTEIQYLDFEIQLENIDNLVLVTPVYVDTIPSSVLEKLVKIEKSVEDKQINLNIYAVTNCGFYEGEQNRLAQKTIEIWSRKCGFTYKGGLGIGAGVMIAFTRTLPFIGIVTELLIILIRMILCFINRDFTIQAIFYHYFPYSFVIQTSLYLMWNMGFFINGFKLARNIAKGADGFLKYTTVWFCPRFLFVIIASIYWFIASMFWYRGPFYRLHKEPSYK